MGSFSAIGHAIFREYVRSAVIIDDQWPEGEVALRDDETEEPPDLLAGMPEDEDVDTPGVRLGAEAAMPPRPVSAEEVDANILSRLRRALMRDGILTCGLRYQQKDRSMASSLAQRADIVVLDWDLAGDDGAEAVEILRPLLGRSLRFVCIWTGHGRAEAVKRRLISELSPTERTNAPNLGNQGRADFSLNNLVIAIRIKEGLEFDPELTVGADEFLAIALEGLRRSFGGLVELALLEMTNRHRDQLPEILEHIGESIDTAVLLEAGDKKSPVGPSGAFVGVLVDEWRSRLERHSDELSALSLAGRKAFGVSLREARSNGWADRLTDIFVGLSVRVNVAERAASVLAPACDQWLNDGCASELPDVPGISKRIAAWGTLQAVRNTDAGLNSLLRLDALFHQQFDEPAAITQGTVVRIRDGEVDRYLVCTTPLCDAERPEKMGGLFNFVKTRIVPTEEVLRGGDVIDYCVLRHGEAFLCLAILLKERISLEIIRPRFDESSIAYARLSLGGTETQGQTVDRIEVHRIAQLRLDHALALTAATASDASRIGVSRVELVRTRMRKNAEKGG